MTSCRLVLRSSFGRRLRTTQAQWSFEGESPTTRGAAPKLICALAALHRCRTLGTWWRQYPVSVARRRVPVARISSSHGSRARGRGRLRHHRPQVKPSIGFGHQCMRQLDVLAENEGQPVEDEQRSHETAHQDHDESTRVLVLASHATCALAKWGCCFQHRRQLGIHTSGTYPRCLPSRTQGSSGSTRHSSSTHWGHCGTLLVRITIQRNTLMGRKKGCSST